MTVQYISQVTFEINAAAQNKNVRGQKSSSSGGGGGGSGGERVQDNKRRQSGEVNKYCEERPLRSQNPGRRPRLPSREKDWVCVCVRVQSSLYNFVKTWGGVIWEELLTTSKLLCSACSNIKGLKALKFKSLTMFYPECLQSGGGARQRRTPCQLYLD